MPKLVEIKARAYRRVKCPGCNRKRTVQRTFSASTDDPDEIKSALDAATADAIAWVPTNRDMWHTACHVI
jgi:transposase-like protein